MSNTTADKLNYLSETKDAIKQAIVDKGVTVDDSTTFREYADKIGSIEGGEGGGIFQCTNERIPESSNPMTLPSFASKSGVNIVLNPFWYGLTKIDTSTYPFQIGWNADNSSWPNWSFDRNYGMCPAPFLEEVILKNLKITKGMNSTFTSTNFNTSPLRKIHIIDCDTIAITSLGKCFYMNNELRELVLENFNTSNVTDMQNMFYKCSSLTSLDLSSFDFSKLGSNFDYQTTYGLHNMFYDCTSLTSIVWPNEVFPNKDGNNTYCSMGGMFDSCSSLVSLDLSSFNTSNVTNMGNMFVSCLKLTNVTWGNNWASNDSITSFSVDHSPLSHDSCLDLFNKLATKTSSATLSLSDTTKGYMSEEEIAIATGKGWTVA